MADEEVTDLTEEEDSESQGGNQKKKKEKPPKAPKPPKEKKEKTPKKPGAKKEKGGSAGIILVMIVVALILIGSFVIAIIYDLFSARAIVADVVRDPLVRLVVWLDPTFSGIDHELYDAAQARENQVTEREEKLEDREADVTRRENLADTRETQLDRRAVELDTWETEIIAMYERTIPLYRRDMTEEELADMQSIATTYSRMAPEDAADRLVRVHTVDDAASILYFMNERNAAAIMAAFRPDFAAEITNVWLYS